MKSNEQFYIGFTLKCEKQLYCSHHVESELSDSLLSWLLTACACNCFFCNQVQPKESSVCKGALLLLYTGDYFLNIKFQDDSARRELPLAWFTLPSVHIKALDTPLQSGAWWHQDDEFISITCKYDRRLLFYHSYSWRVYDILCSWAVGRKHNIDKFTFTF